MHYYRKRAQTNEYKEATIHVDFSIKCKTKQQNKIKSAYYGQCQFSLYTMWIYMEEDKKVTCKSYALVTLENDHSCNVNFTLNNFLINKLKKETMISWSYGCESQFRYQYAFYMMMISLIETYPCNGNFF